MSLSVTSKSVCILFCTVRDLYLSGAAPTSVGLPVCHRELPHASQRKTLPQGGTAFQVQALRGTEVQGKTAQLSIRVSLPLCSFKSSALCRGPAGGWLQCVATLVSAGAQARRALGGSARTPCGTYVQYVSMEAERPIPYLCHLSRSRSRSHAEGRLHYPSASAGFSRAS